MTTRSAPGSRIAPTRRTTLNVSESASSEAYEPLWKAQFAGVQRALIDCAGLQPGERVLGVACGTGLVSFAAAQAVGPRGHVHGIDISGRMVEAAAQRGHDVRVAQTSFTRMDAESLALPDASFDPALCALGLMYLPQRSGQRRVPAALRPRRPEAACATGTRARSNRSAGRPAIASRPNS